MGAGVVHGAACRLTVQMSKQSSVPWGQSMLTEWSVWFQLLVVMAVPMLVFNTVAVPVLVVVCKHHVIRSTHICALLLPCACAGQGQQVS